LAIPSGSSRVAQGGLEGLSREVAARRLAVAYLPRYSPHLNPVGQP